MKMPAPIVTSTYEGHKMYHGGSVHLFGDSRKSYRWWKCDVCHELTQEEKEALNPPSNE